MSRYAIIKVLVLFCVLACFPPQAGAQAGSFDTSYLQGLDDTRYHRLDSSTLERPLHIYVRVPAESVAQPRSTYPVVYLLDGGITYPLLTAYHHYLRFSDELPEMILVGISYGSDAFDGGNYRSTDYTAPSKQREWYGGASGFQQVLQKELFPLIEAHYPARADRRIIFGQSLAGQFVLYTALTRPGLFWGHIASNPALHRNLEFFLDWRGEGDMPAPSTSLFVSRAEFDEPRFRIPAGKWVEYWQAKESRPWRLEVRNLPNKPSF